MVQGNPFFFKNILFQSILLKMYDLNFAQIQLRISIDFSFNLIKIWIYDTKKIIT